jgi:hypothetical protein
MHYCLVFSSIFVLDLLLSWLVGFLGRQLLETRRLVIQWVELRNRVAGIPPRPGGCGLWGQTVTGDAVSTGPIGLPASHEDSSKLRSGLH